MTVEAPGFISDLEHTSPVDGDKVNEGDDHIRTIKESLKIQFTGGSITSPPLGLEGAVTVTHTELNALDGVTGNVEGRIAAIEGNDYIASDGTVAMTGGLILYESPALDPNTAPNQACSRAYALSLNTGGGVAFAGITGNATDNISLNNELNNKKDDFSENTGFNLATGTAAGTVATGNHGHTGFLSSTADDTMNGSLTINSTSAGINISSAGNWGIRVLDNCPTAAFQHTNVATASGWGILLQSSYTNAAIEVNDGQKVSFSSGATKYNISSDIAKTAITFSIGTGNPICHIDLSDGTFKTGAPV